MKKIENEFVTYDLALRMKALGYDEPCFGVYPENGGDVILCGSTNRMRPKLKHILAPTWQSAFVWFLKEYQLHCTITSISQESWQWHITKPGESLGKLYDEDFYTPEEAQQACLEKLCEIVEEVTMKDIEKQIALTEERGQKIVEYLNKYKGQSIYNEIALAIEFGYQIKLKEDEE